MTRPHLLDALRRQVLLCDGGMGSRVQALTLDVERDYWNQENCTEILNLSRPDLVREIHRGYFLAGADMVETNSFGGSPITLGEFDLTDRCFEINKIAAELAREAADTFSDGRHRYVVGSVGPGTKLPSLGNIAYDPLEAALAEQCRGLIAGGVDAILIETCQDTLQIKAAVNGAKIARRFGLPWVTGFILGVNLCPPFAVAVVRAMEMAALAKAYSFDELRVTHAQNIVLPHVRNADLFALWQRLVAADLATANLDAITDIIACPGLDYCSLANARSIPVAQKIAQRFGDAAKQDAIGELKLKISGCINACGHHHAGHIGILGVDRKGTENYQLLLGGSEGADTSLGTITGPGFSEDGIVDAVEKVTDLYLAQREGGERFLDTYRRIGMAAFKEAIYG